MLSAVIARPLRVSQDNVVLDGIQTQTQPPLVTFVLLCNLFFYSIVKKSWLNNGWLK